jgi:putative phosphoribosyl transferase
MTENRNFPDLVGSESSQKDNQLTSAVTRFPDLRSAGRDLALRLEDYRGRDDVVVLGLVLGGVPLAHEVALGLGLPLDLLIIRRLLAPQGPQSQICAVSIGGSMVIDESLLPLSEVPSTPLDHFLTDALAELKRREQICRRGRPSIDLQGKTLLLVDCGIRSGSTMKVAIEALRTRGPAQIIAAVPVASLEGQAAVASLADKLLCLAQPQPFGHVGMWYKDFSRPSDDLVGELL